MSALRSFPKHSWLLLKETAREWNKDNALRLAAALSYYTIFSLAPLLILATAIAGFFLGDEAIKGELSGQLRGLIGDDGAEAVEGLVAGARKPTTGTIATVTSLLAILFGATGVFTELKAALNQIWNAEPKKSSGIWGFLKDRLLSFGMVASIGFLLLVSLLINAALAGVTKYFSGFIPIPPTVIHTLYSVISLGLVTVLFALLFKVLPEVKVQWRDVWVGATLTAVLFTVGKFLIGLYLGKSSIASSFGASASLALILVWTYYSSLILFFGAEFTQVYSEHHGSRKNSGQASNARPNERVLRNAS
jgi:membrane protein